MTTYIRLRSVAPTTYNSATREPSVWGHAWIELSPTPSIPVDRSTWESYGYYSESGNPPTNIRDSDGRGYEGKGYTTDWIPITDEQAKRVRDYTSNTEANRSYWAVPVPGLTPADWWNCATYATEAMREAGVRTTIPFSSVAPWWAPGRYDVPNPESVNGRWRELFNPPRRDPLAIDLDGDGIETVGIPASGAPILFDHDADGVKTGTGWLKPDDAWLVLDRDGNGSIDSGRELFGVDTLITTTQVDASGYTQTVTRNATSGFEALQSLDTGSGSAGSAGLGDRVFNVNDAGFAQVRVWRDLNQDGISQASELQTLAAAGIASISLNATATNTNLGNGNTVTGTAVVTRSNGSTTHIDGVQVSANNLDLADNPFYREFTDTIAWTDAALALPEMGGSGWLRDMREAMSLGTAAATQLQQAVAQFAASTTRDQQLAALGTLISQWAGTTGRVDTSALRPVSATVLSETTTSRTVRYTAMDPGNYPNPATTLVPVAALQLSAEYYETVVQNGVTNKVLTAAGQEVMRRLGQLEAFNGARFINFTAIETLGGGGAGQGTGGSGGGGAAQMTGYQTRWVITLAADQVANINAAYTALTEGVYSALALQTRLRPYLDAVDLVIDETGIRFDTQAMTALLGQRQVTDARNASIDLLDLNKLCFGTLMAVGFDGLATLRQWRDALPADSALRTELAQLDLFSGAQTAGTGRNDVYLGDTAANSFSAGAGSDVLDGAAGNDLLAGVDGDDFMFGGAGNDTLQGGNGNDTLDGGAGNDILAGGVYDTWSGNYWGAGSDTYLFGRGDGQDTLRDVDTTAGVVDRLVFKAGVAPADVQFWRSAEHLILKIAGTTDQVQIDNYFAADATNGWQVEQITFTDSPTTVWSIADIKLMVLTGDAGNNGITGYASNDMLSGDAGNDSLYGRAGADRLIGGAGSDWLFGEDGDDTLLGGADGDTLQGGNGNDTLDGGAGNDILAGGVYDTWSGNYWGAGSDTYLFGRGDGQDTLRDVDTTAGVVDRLVFKAGVAPADVQVLSSGDHLILKIAGTTDQIQIDNYFGANASNGWQVEQITFASEPATVWSVADIKSRMLTGGAGNDTISGFSGNDTLQGMSGNDVLYGLGGDDLMLGGDGSDTLTGGSGADTFAGGAGDDSMAGDAGADIFLFDRNQGKDWIYGQRAEDVVRLGAGVKAGDVRFERYADNLDMIIVQGGVEVGRAVLVYQAFDGGNYNDGVKQIEFADGSVWDFASIRAKALLGTAGSDTNLRGYASADVLAGYAGNDTLFGEGGNDTLEGGDGSDTISGDAGNDTLVGGAGNDTLTGGRQGANNGLGNDTYVFGKGSGQDSIDDKDTSAGNTDRIVYDSSVSASEVQATRTADSLWLTIASTGDTVQVIDYFSNNATGGNAVERVEFADGTFWDVAKVKQLVSAGGAAIGNPALQASATALGSAGDMAADDRRWHSGQPQWGHTAFHQLLQASAGFGTEAAVESTPRMQVAPWRAVDLFSAAA
jgi:Ca2+-binding RTX toxin-like protein